MSERLGIRARDDSLASHILPVSGAMIGVCTTLIGLVKLAEAKYGPSNVDEYAAIAAVTFLASALTSYLPIRWSNRAAVGPRLVRWFVALLCAAALWCPAATARAQTPFYEASARELAGPPGSLIRSEHMMFAPAGAQAYRVLYRSAGMHGEPIAVSGIIVVPPGPAPAGGRPIVAWAHPTTGVVPHCAPSLAIFTFQQMAGLRRLIEQGAVVAATDYPGLGTVGPHPYLVGDSEARAVIDSVRAARNLPGVGEGNRFAVWGHSQGGQASLYTGLIAKTYAPELRLVGVAAAAPATSLVTLMDDDFKTSGGKNLTAMTLWSWSRVYGAPIDKVVLPQAMPTVDRLSTECIESIFDLLERRQTEKPLEQTFLSVPSIATVEPWRSLAVRNTPGALSPQIPLFLAQGTTDNIVRPEVTRAYFQRQCEAGGKVAMMWVPGVGHGLIARDSADGSLRGPACAKRLRQAGFGDGRAEVSARWQRRLTSRFVPGVLPPHRGAVRKDCFP